MTYPELICLGILFVGYAAYFIYLGISMIFTAMKNKYGDLPSIRLMEFVAYMVIFVSVTGGTAITLQTLISALLVKLLSF